MVWDMSRNADTIRCDGRCHRRWPGRELRLRQGMVLCPACSLLFDRGSAMPLPTRTDTPREGRLVQFAPGYSPTTRNLRALPRIRTEQWYSDQTPNKRPRDAK